MPENSKSRTRRILVVDDDQDFAEGLSDLLGLEGYECLIANSMADANRVIEKFDPRVAILDFMLGDGDGFELCKTLKQKCPDMIAILLSAFSASELVDNQEEHLFDRQIRKPLANDELLQFLDASFTTFER
jgi:two-component system OmpR family response regulator